MVYLGLTSSLSDLPRLRAGLFSKQVTKNTAFGGIVDFQAKTDTFNENSVSKKLDPCDQVT